MYAVILRIRLRDASPDSLRAAGEALAAELAGATGLVAVTWLADERPDRFTHVATFSGRAACERFVQGPSIERLRADLRVAEVAVSTHPAAAPPEDRPAAASA